MEKLGGDDEYGEYGGFGVGVTLVVTRCAASSAPAEFLYQPDTLHAVWSAPVFDHLAIFKT
jgi:hypothetical protein